MDPGQRGVELAARRKQLERVEPHQTLGAQGRCDLRVELAQIQRLAAQPRHQVALGEPVLGLRCPARPARSRASWPAAAGARRPSGAARSSVRADASAGADARRGRGSAGRSEHPSRSPPAVRGCAAGRSARPAGWSPACPSAPARSRREGTSARQPLHGLRPLGGGVLAVVGLVEHERRGLERGRARPGARRRCRS